MNRRQFIVSLTASMMLAPAARPQSDAPVWLDFEPDRLRQLLGEGKTVLVDYAAKWCSTCRAQRRIIDDLRRNNPAYDSAITFLRVDWDKYGRHMVTTSRKIPRRSTLILLRGEQELGRLIAVTDPAEIRALLEAGI